MHSLVPFHLLRCLDLFSICRHPALPTETLLQSLALFIPKPCFRAGGPSAHLPSQVVLFGSRSPFTHSSSSPPLSPSEFPSLHKPSVPCFCIPLPRAPSHMHIFQNCYSATFSSTFLICFLSLPFEPSLCPLYFSCVLDLSPPSSTNILGGIF